MLRGDEVGALLGAHILSRGVAPGGVFANSIVSSRLLAAMARAAAAARARTGTRLAAIRSDFEDLTRI